MFAVDTARLEVVCGGGGVESERLTRSSFMLSCVTDGNGFSERVVGEFRNFCLRLQKCKDCRQGLGKRWSPGCVNAAGQARQKW